MTTYRLLTPIFLALWQHIEFWPPFFGAHRLLSPWVPGSLPTTFNEGVPPPGKSSHLLTLTMLISLTTNCRPFSLDLTSNALPNDPSPIFLILWYRSILTRLRQIIWCWCKQTKASQLDSICFWQVIASLTDVKTLVLHRKCGRDIDTITHICAYGECTHHKPCRRLDLVP